VETIGFVRDGITILLLIQQNPIFQRQNVIMLNQYEHDSQARIESHPDRPKSGRTWHFLSSNWPSILIVCLIAGRLGLSYLPEKTMQAIGFSTAIAPAAHEMARPSMVSRMAPTAQTKEMNDLKAQLRDANGRTTDQLQAKLETANRELDAARTEERQRADQLIQFCHSGLLNQLVWLSAWQALAKGQYSAVAGKPCYTASCFKTATDISARLNAETEALRGTHKKVLDALSVPTSEPGCALELPQ
jgi:hypothetical protein